MSIVILPALSEFSEGHALSEFAKGGRRSCLKPAEGSPPPISASPR
jgi:hypothetical protein